MTLRDRIIAEARARLGVPYGLPPGPGQTDCSLYVRDVYEAAGVPFSPGVRTAEQERQDTVPIPWDQVLPGDLLYFEGTYDAGPPSADGHIASHIGISLGAGSHRMLNAVEPVSKESDVSSAYWQEHIFEARRHPALVDVQQDTGGDPDALTDEADHLFTFDQLWPTIEAAGSEFGYDAQALAGIIKQESGFRNWRVHRDGTGHGLLGLDDNGLLSSFERWSGIGVGRGQAAISIPIVPQIRYAAYALADYADRLGGPYAAARAWHRGEGAMNDERGRQYEALIRAHVADLFAAGEPSVPPPTAPAAPPTFRFVRPGDVGTGLLAMMAADNTEPAMPSVFLPLGRSPSLVEECQGMNGTVYRWHLPTGQSWRIKAA